MVILGLFFGLTILLVVRRRVSARGRIQSLVGGLVTLDVVLFLTAVTLGTVGWLASPQGAAAAPSLQQPTGLSGTVAIGAALATGLAAIGAGIAVGIAGSAAIGAITEKPETLGRTLIFVGLAEGVAIYGLIISFLIITRA
jgi:V/A-type H+-transporting ATPase subunit K